MAGKLNPKQERFCREYVVDLNATQAAIRAGYSKRTAYSQGQRLLKHVEIQAEISKRQKAITSRLDLEAERVLRELSLIAFSNMADYLTPGPDGDPYFDFGRITRDQAAALEQVTVDTYMDGRGDDAREVKRVRFRLADKLKALEMLGRHLGLWKGDPPPMQPATITVNLISDRPTAPDVDHHGPSEAQEGP